MAEAETVLVTGGSGYIGSWCVVELLKRGYVVRTTVRDLKREAEVRAAIAKQVDPGNRLSFHVVNLLSDDGWDAAVQGCDYVLHVASPLGVPLPKNPEDLIKPAREGAVRAVSAAIKAGVKRVVLTSSVAAAYKAADGSWTSDETVWTDAGDDRVGPYPQSKTLAERAAWDVIKTADGRTTLVTVNPALVIGPILSPDFSGSVQVISRLLSGRVPGLPRLGFCFVDVRDVVDLHLRAMTDPQAAGQRFIAAGDYAWMGDIAAILRHKLGQQALRVPTRRVPDFLVRIVSLFDTDLRYVVPGLGQRHEFSSAKAQRILGWKARPLEESVVDCAKSLMALGAV